MKRFLLTVLPIALLSACGSVSYNNGGTTPTNPGTTPGSGTTPDPGTGGTTPTTGTILGSGDNGNLHFDFLGCHKFVDPTANVVCDFNFVNNGGDDDWRIYFNDGSYRSKLIFESGNEYQSNGGKSNLGTEWIADSARYIFRSRITYGFMIKFNLPTGTTKAKYLDIFVEQYRYRFNDVAIR